MYTSADLPVQEQKNRFRKLTTLYKCYKKALKDASGKKEVQINKIMNYKKEIKEIFDIYKKKNSPAEIEKKKYLIRKDEENNEIKLNHEKVDLDLTSFSSNNDTDNNDSPFSSPEKKEKLERGSIN